MSEQCIECEKELDFDTTEEILSWCEDCDEPICEKCAEHCFANDVGDVWCTTCRPEGSIDESE